MSNKDLQNFGKKVCKCRKEKNLTQAQLAEMLGMSSNFVGMIERGERSTTLRNVFKIAHVLNMRPLDLFIFD